MIATSLEQITCPTDVYENSTDVSRLLRNDSWELDPQSNATHSVTVGTRGNTTILLVEEDYWQERLSVTLVVVRPSIPDHHRNSWKRCVSYHFPTSSFPLLVHWIHPDRLIRGGHRSS